MNVSCDFSYTSNHDYQSNRCIEFKPGGKLVRRLACSRNTVIKIGDFIFVHAGILPKHIQKVGNNFIQKINDSMKQYLLTGKIDPNMYKIIFSDKNSLLWTRKYNKEDICNKITDVTDYFKVKSIIVGHSVQKNITSICDKSIWKVDVGLSKSMDNNNIEVLEILDNGEAKKENNFKPYRIIKLN